MKHMPLEPNVQNSNIGFVFLLLYSVALFARPQEWSYIPDPFPFARVLLIIAFFCYLILQKPKVWGFQGWYLLGILLLIPLSGLRNGWFFGGFMQAQDFFIYGLLPFLLFSGLVNTQKKHYYLITVFALACVIMLHHGILQKFSLDGIGWTGEPLSQGTRITFVGFFNDPNDLAMFFIMNIPLMIYMKVVSKNSLMKLFYLTLTGALFYGVFLTNSRGGLVGLLSLMFTYFYFKYGKIKSFFMALVTLPLAYMVMSMFRTIDSDEESAYGRIEAWYEGIQMFKYRPLFGVGKGEFIEHHKRTAHNSYVLIMAELGTVGYILWVMTIALTLCMLIRIFNIEQNKYKNIINLKNDILLAKCYFYSLIGFVTTAFFLSRTYVVFLYVFIGLGCALHYRVSKDVPEITDVTDKNKLITLFFTSLVSLIGLYFIIIILL